MSKIAIMGGGSWATAIAKIVVSHTHHIGWYIAYLTSVRFDTSEIFFSSDINKIAQLYDTLIFVTPSPYLKTHLKRLKTRIRDKFIITAIKGIVPDDNLCCSEYQAFADIISSNFIKTKVSTDVLGIEYSSVLKNVYAIAAGICSGLKYGDNFQAVLMSNAMQEMQRFLTSVRTAYIWATSSSRATATSRETAPSER